jgi:hypothetical protein
MKQIDIHHKLNLLVDHHSWRAKIFIVIILIRRHLVRSRFLFDSFWKFTQVIVQLVPLKITCIEEDTTTLLNTISLRLNHIAHNMAPIPTRKICPLLEFMTYPQAPDICLILLGGTNPETKYTTLHINLASAQSKKRCCRPSSLSA